MPRGASPRAQLPTSRRETPPLAGPEEAFGEVALFFYDKYGGEVIGVLWKPSGFEPQPFKASTMRGRMLAPSSESLTVPNVAAILEDFEILGEGLVRAVETRTEKWSI
ncbi:UNVERIFIED_CONTAM: Nucleolar protein 6 [Gekko kuhli]